MVERERGGSWERRNELVTGMSMSSARTARSYSIVKSSYANAAEDTSSNIEPSQSHRRNSTEGMVCSQDSRLSRPFLWNNHPTSSRGRRDCAAKQTVGLSHTWTCRSALPRSRLKTEEQSRKKQGTPECSPTALDGINETRATHQHGKTVPMLSNLGFGNRHLRRQPGRFSSAFCRQKIIAVLKSNRAICRVSRAPYRGHV